MSRRRPRSASFSPLSITFAELAWLGVLAVGLLLFQAQREGRRAREVIAGATEPFGIKEDDLAAALAERRQLLEEVAALRAIQERLRQFEAGMLAHDAKIASLEQERDKLLAEVASLRTRALETEAQILRIPNLESENARLKNEKQELNKALVAARAEMAAFRAAAESITRAADELLAAQARIATLEKELKATRDKLGTTTDRLTSATMQMAREAGVKPMLIGLKRDVAEKTGERCVMIFDTSDSVLGAGQGAEEKAYGIVKAWLQFFPMEKVAVITYGEEIRSFPENDYLTLRSPRGELVTESLDRLVQHLRTSERAQATDTAAALAKAFSYPGVNYIILFTDGKANTGKQDLLQIWQAIHGMTQARRQQIPIHVIGLGNYVSIKKEEDPQGVNAEVFYEMLRLSRETGGVFVAR